MIHARPPALRRSLPLLPVLAFVLAALMAAVIAAPTAAETRTKSQDDVLSAALLPGWQMESGAHMAGLRMDLAPGWKTYWRSPGDAGIPPEFDWSGSENVKSARIHWPAPTLFHTNGFLTIGYKGGVVLPVEVQPIDPARPVVLRAKVELGVCRDICMPAWLDLAASVTPPGTPDRSIRAALAARPATAAEAGLTALGCAVDPIADGLRITATLALPPGQGDEAVAFETDDPRIWVAEAITERHGGRLVAVTEMVGPGGQPFALDRSGVTLTVISDSGAVEIRGCPAP